ncbi:MAG: DUF401 family protein [Candidatus Nezhaarchaeales archaeon]
MDTLFVLIATIVIIIVLLVLKRPVYIVLAIAIFLASLIYGGPSFLISSATRALLDPDTWTLTLSIFAVASLAMLYGTTGIAARMGNEFSKCVRNETLALSLAPGIMGLLPIPGGALMSAPIVDAIGDRLGLSRSKKSFANVWYEHIIVPIYPLDPMIMVASAISGFSIPSIIAKLFPMIVIMYLIGLPLIGVRRSKIQEKADYLGLSKALLPILLAAVIALSTLSLDQLLGVSRVSIVIAIFIAFIVFKNLNGVDIKTILKCLRDRRVWEITVLILELAVFGEMILSMDMSQVVPYLASIKELILIGLPMLLAALGGHPAIGVIVAMPIALQVGGFSLSTACMVYFSAFISYLISPLHLCLVYTIRYFNASLKDSYRYLVPTAIALLVASYVVLLML